MPKQNKIENLEEDTLDQTKTVRQQLQEAIDNNYMSEDNGSDYDDELFKSSRESQNKGED
jgi:hypothetical protein